MQNKRVLVADENANSRELLRILLEHEGLVVSEASDGVQALAMARVLLPDLIFLDLDLPELDGYDVVSELRRDARLGNRPIVALTESSRSDESDQLRKAGFTTNLTKPVVLLGLRKRLAELFPTKGEGPQGRLPACAV